MVSSTAGAAKFLTSSPHSHLANNVMNCSLKFPGTFDMRKLELTMDSLIYGNASTEHTVSNEAGAAGLLSGATTGIMQVEKDTKAAGTSVPINKHGVIFRMKGVLYANSENDIPPHDSPQLYLLQTVHELFEIRRSSVKVGDVSDPTNGCNLIIVIGCNLRIDAIEATLKDCLSSQ